jgi:hypothetical protein
MYPPSLVFSAQEIMSEPRPLTVLLNSLHPEKTAADKQRMNNAANLDFMNTSPSDQ